MVDDNKYDVILQAAVKEISERHQQIIDDWSKAYLAQLYQEGIDIKPGCFTLCEQEPTFHEGKNCMVRKYWFEQRRENTYEEGQGE